MTTEHTRPGGQQQGKITQAGILRLANLIRDELLTGDRDSALRLLESAMTPSTPFPMLDLLGQVIARTTAQTVPGAFLTLLDNIAHTRTPGAWPFIGSAIYAAFARTMLPSAMQHARRHIARATVHNAADMIGERVPGQILVDYFEEGLSQLYDWVSDPSPWVRRAMGVAVHFYVERHPQEQGQIARLLQLLSFLYQEEDTDAIEGIGRGLKIISKHQPEMITYWLYEQRELGKQPRALMLHQATAYLSDATKAEFVAQMDADE
jgi:hypothetical protein